jgi:hypothetical protein
VLAGVFLLVAASPLWALGGAKKEERALALIAGTVFSPSGFAQRAAEITVAPAADGSPEPPTGKKKVKFKPLKAVSDSRGEFAVRVPGGPARYTVTVRAEGCKAVEKQVQFSADERQDLSIVLERQ